MENLLWSSDIMAEYSTGAVLRLKKRSDFVKLAKGRRWSTNNFTLQAALRFPKTEIGSDAIEKRMSDPDTLAHPRLGLTVTKKVGESVERNRIRRRLKGALAVSQAQLLEMGFLKPDFDYVIIARRSAIDTPFTNLVDDLTSAFRGVHRERSSAKANHKI